jgi:hypothetical protein
LLLKLCEAWKRRYSSIIGFVLKRSDALLSDIKIQVAPTVTQEYFVLPLPEEDIFTTFKSINDVARAPIYPMTSITIATTATLIT